MAGLQLFDVVGSGMRFGLTDDGRPYVVAEDFTPRLGYSRARDALRMVDEDEKGAQIVRTPGGDQSVSVLYEDGIWELIFLSRRAEAKAIKKRVKAILRQIRETGHYGAAPRFEIPQTYAEALRLAATQSEEIEQQRRVLAVTGPKAQAWDTLASADPDYSVREAAYILNRDPAIDTGQNRLFVQMRAMRVIDSRDIPYANHARHVKLRARSFTNRATNEETAAKPQVRITAEGLAYLHKRLGGTAPLRLDEQLAIEGSQ